MVSELDLGTLADEELTGYKVRELLSQSKMQSSFIRCTSISSMAQALPLCLSYTSHTRSVPTSSPNPFFDQTHLSAASPA